ncbi:fructosamine kinase family protein [Marinibactrum halimedae]|nr:fructosamine kinase family protein [Marinibactrum halimedae]MCD9458004.1 fructosamine kinase family protein [Marinibactrum halimedae]
MADWLEQEGLGTMKSAIALQGGDICKTFRVTLDDDSFLCVKERPSELTEYDNLLSSEATGLRALRNAQERIENPLRIPEVVAIGEEFLVLEFIQRGQPDRLSWQRLGRALAELHKLPVPGFGFSCNNFCGSTVQVNTQHKDGYTFYAECRLHYQKKLAIDNGLLSPQEGESIDYLCDQLPYLIPEQPPCLLHGDLWSGNVLFDEKGAPVLIDPACYYGWAEADIAMTKLFGGFDEAFYDAYNEINPLEPDWEERVAIYNIYHLLNHLNLFGISYYPQVMASLTPYTQKRALPRYL